MNKQTLYLFFNKFPEKNFTRYTSILPHKLICHYKCCTACLYIQRGGISNGSGSV